MKKLNLDALRVESFVTEEGSAAMGGTVRGHQQVTLRTFGEVTCNGEGSCAYTCPGMPYMTFCNVNTCNGC